MCDGYYRDHTIEGAFQIVDRTLSDYSLKLEVRYNETYGFPEYVRVTHCCIGHRPNITLSDFKPLEP
jgi:hypothetical protein